MCSFYGHYLKFKTYYNYTLKLFKHDKYDNYSHL